MEDYYKYKLKTYRFYFPYFVIFLILGLTFNLIVLSANNWKMPVLSEYDFNTSTHFSYNEPSEINLFQLSDIFRIKRLTFSLGDFLMTISIFNLLVLFILITKWEFKLSRFLKARAEKYKIFYEEE